MYLDNVIIMILRYLWLTSRILQMRSSMIPHNEFPASRACLGDLESISENFKSEFSLWFETKNRKNFRFSVISGQPSVN